MNRPIQSTVEELLLQIDAMPAAPDKGFELWIPTNLTLRGQPVRADVAMAIILDRILGLGCEPDGFTEMEGGRIYKYKVTP